MKMADKILMAKHWQLFLLTWGIQIIFQFIWVGLQIVNMKNGAGPKPQSLFSLMPMMLFGTIIFFCVHFAWFWSVAIGIQNKIPVNLKMKTRWFKLLILFQVVYISLIYISVVAGMILVPKMPENGMETLLSVVPNFVFVIVLLHLVAIFCCCYSIYFVAKSLKTAELQRETSFTDFSGEMFSIWWFPIGIWALQPRINKLSLGSDC